MKKMLSFKLIVMNQLLKRILMNWNKKINNDIDIPYSMNIFCNFKIYIYIYIHNIKYLIYKNYINFIKYIILFPQVLHTLILVYL